MRPSAKLFPKFHQALAVCISNYESTRRAAPCKETDWVGYLLDRAWQALGLGAVL